ncbi:MAG TPA: DUF5011 domain-containing protein [Bacteroidetes bacterium]|nr:DUF5011 domain-containing protein [Bacteroidota bacterium]
MVIKLNVWNNYFKKINSNSKSLILTRIIKSMKHTKFTTLVALFLGLTLVFASCKKEDTLAPTLTLKGSNPGSVLLGGSYTDPGATATDEEDGDLTSKIKVTGTVNTNAVGTYTLTYSVVDAAGNSTTVTRTVNVTVNRDTYLGNYTTSEDCPQPYGLNSSPTISAGNAANEIVVSLYYFNGGSLLLNVDGSNVTVAANQNPAPVGDHVAGTGTLSADGRSITMNMTMTPQVGQAVSCTVTWTK